MHKTSYDLASICDEETIILYLGTIVSHRGKLKVGVVKHLRMRVVHNFVNFLPLY